MVNIESIEFDDDITQRSLRPKELEAVYAISQAVATGAETEEILEQNYSGNSTCIHF